MASNAATKDGKRFYELTSKQAADMCNSLVSYNYDLENHSTTENPFEIKTSSYSYQKSLNQKNVQP